MHGAGCGSCGGLEDPKKCTDCISRDGSAVEQPVSQCCTAHVVLKKLGTANLSYLLCFVADPHSVKVMARGITSV